MILIYKFVLKSLMLVI